MQKRIIFFICFIMFYLFSFVEVEASTDDYRTFSEIIMSEGKLITNFTDEEYNEMIKKLTGVKCFGYSTYIENKNVDATYISNTLYSIENKGNTPVTYQIDVVIDTKNTVTFSASRSLNGELSASSKAKGLKGELGSKVGLNYTSEMSESRKETQKLDVVVEPQSRCVIYLTGNLTISNGVACIHTFFIKSAYGAFEIVVLKNQYTRIEKDKIWKNYIFLF